MVIRKYLIVKGSPILFSLDFLHADMVSAAGEVESAGFFLLRKNKADKSLSVICIGESSSLSVPSRPDLDKQLIETYLGLN